MVRQRNQLHTTIRNSQYYFLSNKDTPLYEVEEKFNEHGLQLTATVYELNKYDYITKADRFVLIVEGDEPLINLPYQRLHDIAPFSWHRIDEEQYFAQKLDADEWATLVKKAREF